MKTRSRFIRACIFIVAVWLIIFALMPNLFLLVISFLTQDEERYVLLQLTLSNYSRLLEPSFVKIFFDSIYLALAATGLCLLFGYPFAYFVARASKKMRQWFLLLIIVPFWTSSIILIYAIMLILQNNGLISKLLQFVGVTNQPVSFMYTEVTVLAGLVYTMLPFMVMPIYAAVEKLDTRLVDAARDLGAGPLRTFWHVILPVTSPGILAGSMLVFLPSLTLFYVPDILGGGQGLLLGNYIQNQFTKPIQDWPLGAASSSVLTLALLLLMAAYKWSLRLSQQKDDTAISISSKAKKGDKYPETSPYSFKESSL